MILTALDKTIKELATKLKNDYGYCGLANGQEFAQLNTDNGDFEIKITVQLKAIEK